MNSEPSRNRYIIISAAVLILIVIGAYFYWRHRASEAREPWFAGFRAEESETDASVYEQKGAEPASNQNQAIATSSDGTINSLTPFGNTIKVDSSAESTAPSLERAVPANTINLDAGYREKIISDLNKTASALMKDAKVYQDWIYLGLYRKILGDYEGALVAWRYAASLSPSEEVAYLNLANLYDLVLKDYAQAESYYKKAISLNPADTDAYRNLFEMYRYRHQGASAAENILKKGIAKNPEALDLYVILARFYGETGRAADARAQYDLAIALAKKQNNVSAVASLEQEKSALK